MSDPSRPHTGPAPVALRRVPRSAPVIVIGDPAPPAPPAFRRGPVQDESGHLDPIDRLAMEEIEGRSPLRREWPESVS